MLLKIIGSSIVLLVTTIGGFYYGNIESYRIYDLLEFKRALGILRSEVEFALTPLKEAFSNIANRVREPIRYMFLTLEKKLDSNSNEIISEIWRSSIEENVNKTYFSKEDIDEIIVFGKTLGYLDRGMQMQSIDILTEYIDEKIKQLDKTRIKNKKMYRSMGVLGGILIIIVLI